MTPAHTHIDSERAAIVRWAAGLGAVTAEAVAVHLGITPASARGRLLGAVRAGLLARHRPLIARPTLYAVTRAGLRAVGEEGMDPCRVSASGAAHLIECAHVAAALEHCYPDHRVQGERELRREERAQGHPLASAVLGVGAHGGRSELDRSEPDRSGGTLASGEHLPFGQHPPFGSYPRFDRSRETLASSSYPRFSQQRHCPDLVLWPRDPDGGLPVAVEVELTIKAPARLAEICQAWTRTRQVAGVLYLAPPEVERALLRAIDRVHAHDRVVVVPLRALPNGPAEAPAERTVPSGS